MWIKTTEFSTSKTQNCGKLFYSSWKLPTKPWKTRIRQNRQMHKFTFSPTKAQKKPKSMYFCGILNEFIQFYAKRRFFKKQEYFLLPCGKTCGNCGKLWNPCPIRLYNGCLPVENFLKLLSSPFSTKSDFLLYAQTLKKWQELCKI